MIELGIATTFLAAAVRVGTPLGLAAVGEAVAEKSGVINLGIEGAMLAGAFAAAAGAAQFGVAGGIFAGVVAGTTVSAIFAAVVVGARVDQIIAGTAVTLGATGLTGMLAEKIWGRSGAGLSLSTLGAAPIPGLAKIPILGDAFFRQSLLTYLAYIAIPVVSWMLYRTRFGLELRASGEAPASARAAGVRVGRTRAIATLIGGAFAGVAGASLVLAQVGTFTERMTGGRGFIAIAIVALGRWHPGGVAAAALLFGGTTALQYLFQASGTAVPYQLFVAMPYLLALAVLALTVGRSRGPAALGQPH